MLKIRDEQFDAFLPQDDEDLIDLIVRHLRQESPELIEGIPADSLRDMVRNGIARARSHGLRSAEDLAAFVSVMFEIAPNFDEHPAIRRVLRDESIPVDERFDQLFERVSDEEWEEADRSYDQRAWFPERRDGGR